MNAIRNIISGEQVYQALLQVRQENRFECTRTCNFLSLVEIDAKTLLVRHDTTGTAAVEKAVKEQLEACDFERNRELPPYEVLVTFAVGREALHQGDVYPGASSGN